MKRMQRRRWARFELGATLCPDHTGRPHGPEPHPELHARCRLCGNRWPQHDAVLGTCPDAVERPEDWSMRMLVAAVHHGEHSPQFREAQARAIGRVPRIFGLLATPVTSY